MKKQLLFSFSILGILLLVTIGVIAYGRGYRFGLDESGKPRLKGTGLLVATSNPDGAQVFINDHLTTATDNTLNLAPGTYKIRIFKEGYFPWEKTITVQEEVVAKAEALLFPNAPKLENITTLGVNNPTLDPSLSRIAYTIASQSAKKNGVYVLDISARPIITLQSSSTQLADDTANSYSQMNLAWSPDGQNLLATTPASPSSTFLLRPNGFNDNPQDVTNTLPSLQSQWQVEQAAKDKSRMNSLKSNLRAVVGANFKIMSYSPDESKILYEASQSATLPYVISPRLIGTEATPEDRDLKIGSVYVYDIKEDKNYKLPVGAAVTKPNNSAGLIWLTSSRHLVYVHDKRIDIMEFDGTNSTTVYAGPFLDNYVFPLPNVSKLVILTNLGNPSIPPNLYTVSLR